MLFILTIRITVYSADRIARRTFLDYASDPLTLKDKKISCKVIKQIRVILTKKRKYTGLFRENNNKTEIIYASG